MNADLAGTDDKRYGWINPFNLVNANVTDPPSPEWQQHHVLLANQLRYCYSMFGGGINGIERLEIDGVHEYPNQLVNVSFEPASTYAYDSKLRDTPYPGTAAEWDQKNPWGRD